MAVDTGRASHRRFRDKALAREVMPELTNRRLHGRGGRWTLTEQLMLLKMASRACWLAYVRADDLQEALAPLLAFIGAMGWA